MVHKIHFDGLVGIIFLFMEFSMTHSPVARLFFALLKQNKQLSDKEAKKYVPMVVTRVVGFIHNAVQVRAILVHARV
jgi:hypothetical protein